jgi:hypothetical protein
LVPSSFTGNPVPSWATLSRPYGTDRDLVIADLISASAVQY